MSEDIAADLSASGLAHHAKARLRAELGTHVDVSRAPLDPDWDAFVDSAPGGHHLQTSLWAQVKARHGWKPVRLRVQRDGEFVGGAQLLVRRMRLGAIGYCPRGPLLCDNDPATLRAFLDGLARMARRERILYVKVQPPVGRGDMEPILREAGFVASDMQASPAATVRVDLGRSADEILASMRAATRKNIRKATRKGIVVRAAGASGLTAFGELLAETSRRQRFAPYPEEYAAEVVRQFGEGDRAELLLAEHDGEVLSGVMIVGYGDTVVYTLGGWSGGRTTGLHPNELVHWSAMQWAREHGYRYYDLYGIDRSAARAVLAGEELPGSGHRGFTHFKLGFGGEVTLDPSTYDRSFQRLLVWPARIAAPRLNHLGSLAHRLQGRGPRPG
jgi:peptidoglycan pentaglycine glycine transferase (the first glycine)